MITAYLIGTSSYYEGEDIELKFKVYNEDELILDELMFQKYQKPAVVEHFALLELLKRLRPYKESKITIILNNGALYEQLKGSFIPKERYILKMIDILKDEIDGFTGSLIFKDVSTNKEGLKKWREVLI